MPLVTVAGLVWPCGPELHTSIAPLKGVEFASILFEETEMGELSS